MHLKLSSKQRAYLRSEAHHLESIIHIGKNGVTPEVVTSVAEAIEKRELIKVNVLKNCMEDPSYVAQVLSERTRSTLIQVMGRRITLYHPIKDEPIYTLPR